MLASYTSLISGEVLSEGALQVLRARGESPVLQDGFSRRVQYLVYVRGLDRQ
jgi:hypothetical protein